MSRYDLLDKWLPKYSLLGLNCILHPELSITLFRAPFWHACICRPTLLGTVLLALFSELRLFYCNNSKSGTWRKCQHYLSGDKISCVWSLSKWNLHPPEAQPTYLQPTRPSPARSSCSSRTKTRWRNRIQRCSGKASCPPEVPPISTHPYHSEKLCVWSLGLDLNHSLEEKHQRNRWA